MNSNKSIKLSAGDKVLILDRQNLENSFGTVIANKINPDHFNIFWDKIDKSKGKNYESVHFDSSGKYIHPTAAYRDDFVGDRCILLGKVTEQELFAIRLKYGV